LPPIRTKPEYPGWVLRKCVGASVRPRKGKRAITFPVNIIVAYYEILWSPAGRQKLGFHFYAKKPACISASRAGVRNILKSNYSDILF